LGDGRFSPRDAFGFRPVSRQRLRWTVSSDLSFRDSPRGARPHEVPLRLDRSNLRILLTGYRQSLTKRFPTSPVGSYKRSRGCERPVSSLPQSFPAWKTPFWSDLTRSSCLCPSALSERGNGESDSNRTFQPYMRKAASRSWRRAGLNLTGSVSSSVPRGTHTYENIRPIPSRSTRFGDRPRGVYGLGSRGCSVEARASQLGVIMGKRIFEIRRHLGLGIVLAVCTRLSLAPWASGA
jgi:hypothetical protein